MTPLPETCVGCGEVKGGPCPLVCKIPGAICPLILHAEQDVPLLDAGATCLWCGVSVAPGSGNFVNRIPADRGGVDGWMCAECEGCEDGMVFFWCNECGDYTPGNDNPECQICGEQQDEKRAAGPDVVPALCVVCRVSW